MVQAVKAVALTGMRQVQLIDVPRPAIKKDTDVLLKIERVGVCGSDMHYYETGRIGPRKVQFPFVIGHECAATVVETGAGAKRVQVGQTVAVDPAMPCHQCDQCREGRQNTCRHLTFLGCPGEAQGCLSEFLVMPEECLYPLGGKLSAEQGALCEPLSIAIYAVQQSHLRAGSAIGILGAGPIGLCVLLAAESQSAGGTYVTDRLDQRVAVARKAGATWAGNPERENVVNAMLGSRPEGLDAVFECAGQQATIDQAVEMLKPGGRLMLVGIPREERISFVIDLLRRKEISVINVRRQNKCVQAAIDMIGASPARFEFLVTHRSPAEQASEAFERVADYRDGVIKAMIQLG
jgi:L-iditol 2-dehydrogenase